MKKILCILLASIFLIAFTACGDDTVTDSIIAITEPATTEIETEITTEPKTEKEVTEAQTTTTTTRVTITAAQTTVAQTTTTTYSQSNVNPGGQESNNVGGSSSGYVSGGGSVSVPEPETGPSLVWVPVNGGTKYHSYAGCSNMIDPIQVTVETAMANGYTACKRCW